MNYCKRGLIFFSLIIFLLAGGISATEKMDELFPVYESIKPNIAFWIKVYSEYTTSQVIIHDKRNLSLIYEIIFIKGKDEPDAHRYNKNILDKKKDHYSDMLKRLASGHKPSSEEEKRIHGLFSDNNLKHLLKEAHDNVRAQLGQKDRFIAGLVRSGAHIDEIREILKSHGLPEDLAYLPHVESSFDYQAYSKFGAAGIWQFTNSTGKRYLKIDYTVDERRDPILATHAAARFLKENYNILGSWPVALTAYNHGPQGMQRAVKAHGSYEKIYKSYDSRSFGFASRNFYSEFLAAREVASNYRKYFGELKLDDPVKRVMVSIPGNVAIGDLASHYNISISELKELNPAIREPVYLNQKYVPKGSRLFLRPVAASNIKAASIDIPAKLLKEDQKPSHFYLVKKGDTANRIARDHKVRLQDLIDANNLNSRAAIYVGQNLRIPVAGEKIAALSVSDKEEANKKKELEKISAETIKPASNLPANKPGAPISTGNEGSEIVALPPPDSVAETVLINPAIVTGDFSVKKVTLVNGKSVGTIKVEPEENLGRYASWLQTSSQKIRALNGFSSKVNIRIGQNIKIPLNNVSNETFEERRYEYHKEIEEDFFALYRVERTEEYKIKRGDNLWSLCEEKFEVPFWLLKKYNPDTDFSSLSSLQKLIVPVIVKVGDETGIN
jgi:membrane-bound lytic murein transglycosylase D